MNTDGVVRTRGTNTSRKASQDRAKDMEKSKTAFEKGKPKRASEKGKPKTLVPRLDDVESDDFTSSSDVESDSSPDVSIDIGRSRESETYDRNLTARLNEDFLSGQGNSFSFKKNDSPPISKQDAFKSCSMNLSPDLPSPAKITCHRFPEVRPRAEAPESSHLQSEASSIDNEENDSVVIDMLGISKSKDVAKESLKDVDEIETQKVRSPSTGNPKVSNPIVAPAVPSSSRQSELDAMIPPIPSAAELLGRDYNPYHFRASAAHDNNLRKTYILRESGFNEDDDNGISKAIGTFDAVAYTVHGDETNLGSTGYGDTSTVGSNSMAAASTAVVQQEENVATEEQLILADKLALANHGRRKESKDEEVRKASKGISKSSNYESILSSRTVSHNGNPESSRSSSDSDLFRKLDGLLSKGEPSCITAGNSDVGSKETVTIWKGVSKAVSTQSCDINTLDESKLNESTLNDSTLKEAVGVSKDTIKMKSKEIDEVKGEAQIQSKEAAAMQPQSKDGLNSSFGLMGSSEDLPKIVENSASISKIIQERISLLKEEQRRSMLKDDLLLKEEFSSGTTLTAETKKSETIAKVEKQESNRSKPKSHEFISTDSLYALSSRVRSWANVNRDNTLITPIDDGNVTTPWNAAPKCLEFHYVALRYLELIQGFAEQSGMLKIGLIERVAPDGSRGLWLIESQGNVQVTSNIHTPCLTRTIPNNPVHEQTKERAEDTFITKIDAEKGSTEKQGVPNSNSEAVHEKYQQGLHTQYPSSYGALALIPAGERVRSPDVPESETKTVLGSKTLQLIAAPNGAYQKGIVPFDDRLPFDDMVPFEHGSLQKVFGVFHTDYVRAYQEYADAQRLSGISKEEVEVKNEAELKQKGTRMYEIIEKDSQNTKMDAERLLRESNNSNKNRLPDFNFQLKEVPITAAEYAVLERAIDKDRKAVSRDLKHYQERYHKLIWWLPILYALLFWTLLIPPIIHLIAVCQYKRRYISARQRIQQMDCCLQILQHNVRRTIHLPKENSSNDKKSFDEKSIDIAKNINGTEKIDGKSTDGDVKIQADDDGGREILVQNIIDSRGNNILHFILVNPSADKPSLDKEELKQTVKAFDESDPYRSASELRGFKTDAKRGGKSNAVAKQEGSKQPAKGSKNCLKRSVKRIDSIVDASLPEEMLEKVVETIIRRWQIQADLRQQMEKEIEESREEMEKFLREDKTASTEKPPPRVMEVENSPYSLELNTYDPEQRRFAVSREFAARRECYGQYEWDDTYGVGSQDYDPFLRAAQYYDVSLNTLLLIKLRKRLEEVQLELEEAQQDSYCSCFTDLYHVLLQDRHQLYSEWQAALFRLQTAENLQHDWENDRLESVQVRLEARKEKQRLYDEEIRRMVAEDEAERRSKQEQRRITEDVDSSPDDQKVSMVAEKKSIKKQEDAKRSIAETEKRVGDERSLSANGSSAPGNSGSTVISQPKKEGASSMALQE